MQARTFVLIYTYVYIIRKFSSMGRWRSIRMGKDFATNFNCQNLVRHGGCLSFPNPHATILNLWISSFDSDVANRSQARATPKMELTNFIFHFRFFSLFRIVCEDGRDESAPRGCLLGGASTYINPYC